ncbi:hypothetical protein [Streptomyces mirabilis]|uniref:hypothetical protein n=1 Tax=Streptomyces mirabilis TaxID=68239 RepID=UPI00367B335A
MNYEEDSRRDEAGRSKLMMFVGGGKTMSAGLMAYWHAMQTPVAGEDDPEGTADGRFTPLSDDELEQRLASLHDRTVEPLPEEIESLADSSTLNREGGHEGAESAVKGVVHKQLHWWDFSGPTASRFLGRADVFQDHCRAELTNACCDDLEEATLYYSTVLVCKTIRPMVLPRRKQWLTDRRLERRRNAQAFWHALDGYECESNTWLEAGPDALSTQGQVPYVPCAPYTFTSSHEPLREAVQAYFTHFTLRCDIKIVVDNVGAARDPNAALRSLIADATSFSAATDSAGRWALLMTAPAPREAPEHARGRPRVAVMELPVDPPPGTELAPGNEESALMRTIVNSLVSAK